MGKANIVLAYTRMKKIFVKQGKIPLFHHHFRLCFEVDRNRSTRVDLLRPYRVFITKLSFVRTLDTFLSLSFLNIVLFVSRFSALFSFYPAIAS